MLTKIILTSAVMALSFSNSYADELRLIPNQKITEIMYDGKKYYDLFSKTSYEIEISYNYDENLVATINLGKINDFPYSIDCKVEKQSTQFEKDVCHFADALIVDFFSGEIKGTTVAKLVDLEKQADKLLKSPYDN